LGDRPAKPCPQTGPVRRAAFIPPCRSIYGASLWVSTPGQRRRHQIDAPDRALHYGRPASPFVSRWLAEMATRRPMREPASVSDDRRTTVRGKLTHHVGGDASYTVRQNRTAEIGRNDDLKVGGDCSSAVGGAARETVGGDRTTDIGGSDALTIGRDRSTSIGKDDRLSVGKKLLIEAGDEVTIKCGSASITLKKDGTVTIKGKDIAIEASGDATLKAGKNIVLKGKKIVENGTM
jgi:hypothetical protein